MPTVTWTEYCLCGASIHLTGQSRAKVNSAIAAWQELHTGEGHGLATRQQAYMARIKNDKRAAKTALEATRETPA